MSDDSKTILWIVGIMIVIWFIAAAQTRQSGYISEDEQLDYVESTQMLIH